MKIEPDLDSFQATLAGDRRFFLRRLVEPENRLTDLIFGDVPPLVQPVLLNEFMLRTGGWPLEWLEYDALGYDADDESILSGEEARVRELVNAAKPRATVTQLERTQYWRRIILRMKIEPDF